MKKFLLFVLLSFFLSQQLSAQMLSGSYDPLSAYSSATPAGMLVTGAVLLGTLFIVNGVEVNVEAPVATKNYNDGQGTIYRALPYGGSINMTYTDQTGWYFLSGLGIIGYSSTYNDAPKNTLMFATGNIGIGYLQNLKMQPNFLIGGAVICSPVFFKEAAQPMPDFMVKFYAEAAYQKNAAKGFLRIGADQTGSVLFSVGFRTN